MREIFGCISLGLVAAYNPLIVLVFFTDLIRAVFLPAGMYRMFSVL
jgi:hypothetical protein